MSSCPSHGHGPSRADHGQPVAHDERVDERDQQRERHAPRRARAAPRPSTRAGRGGEHGAAAAPRARAVLERQRDRRQRPRTTPTATPARAACSGAWRRRYVTVPTLRPSAARAPLRQASALWATGSRRRARPRSRRAKRSVRRSSSSAAAAAATPASSVPVTTHVGAWSPVAVAATRPLPGPSVRTGRPRSSSSSIRRPSGPDPGEHADCAGAALDPLGRRRPRAPAASAPTTIRSTPSSTPTADRRPRDPRHARVLQPRGDLVAGVARRRARSRAGPAGACRLARQERLGKRADDGRDPHRGAPVVAVPPDAVARCDVALGSPRSRPRCR